MTKRIKTKDLPKIKCPPCLIDSDSAVFEHGSDDEDSLFEAVEEACVFIYGTRNYLFHLAEFEAHAVVGMTVPFGKYNVQCRVFR